MTKVVENMNFIRFARENLTATGIVGDPSTAVVVLTFFVSGLESVRPVLYVSIVGGFIGSAFRIYVREADSRLDRE